MIADLILPGSRGTDVALRAVQYCPGLPVLFVSGTPYEAWTESDRQKSCALPAGTAAFLAKPFRPSALIDKLTALLTAGEFNGAGLRPAQSARSAPHVG
jgi:CheY-like chemotaxis protein